jgi:hypothetical protein
VCGRDRWLCNILLSIVSLIRILADFSINYVSNGYVCVVLLWRVGLVLWGLCLCISIRFLFVLCSYIVLAFFNVENVIKRGYKYSET